MPPNPRKDLPPPAEPQFGRNFDPWNSVSAGHQRAETRGPQGWRESRNLKMNSQFRAGNSGGQRIPDTVGAGSDDFDERLGMLVPKELRARAAKSVADMLRNPGSMRRTTKNAPLSSSTSGGSGNDVAGEGNGEDGGDAGNSELADRGYEVGDDGRTSQRQVQQQQQQQSRIFDGLVVYVNGSTHPLVSDHKLKHLLSEHGARMSLHLGRRQVTHVILGKPSGPNGGAGGGLAGGKLEKEIRRVGGCGIKSVGVEW
jgi:hypothetical protein